MKFIIFFGLLCVTTYGQSLTLDCTSTGDDLKLYATLHMSLGKYDVEEGELGSSQFFRNAPVSGELILNAFDGQGRPIPFMNQRFPLTGNVFHQKWSDDNSRQGGNFYAIPRDQEGSLSERIANAKDAQTQKAILEEINGPLLITEDRALVSVIVQQGVMRGTMKPYFYQDFTLRMRAAQSTSLLSHYSIVLHCHHERWPFPTLAQ